MTGIPALLSLWTVAAAPPPVTALAYAHQEVVVGSQAGVRALSWPKREPLRDLQTKAEHVCDLAFSPAADVLAVAGGSPGEAGLVEFYRWPKGEFLRRVECGANVVQAVAWCPHGKQLVAAGADGICRLLDVETGRIALTYRGHSGPVNAVVWLPRNNTLVSAGADNSLRVWEAATGKTLRVLENHTAPVLALAVRPEPNKDAPAIVVSLGKDRTVRLWQPETGRMLRFLRLPVIPLSVCWSPDGKELALGCVDGSVRFIDAESLEVLSVKKTEVGWVHALVRTGPVMTLLAGGEQGELVEISLPSPTR